jgi:excisionase family DNA binding protein
MAKKSQKQISTTPVEARLFNVRAAAAYLSATVWYVRTLAWERRVPHLKCGARLLFDKKDLDQFIENEKVAVGR